ncbi:MAG: DUF983 domain-containing protein [Chitinophagaceae bacterium]
MKEEEVARGYLATVFSCRCPRCREGKLFKNPIALGLTRNMEMYEACTLCGQPTDIELGFYYGTGYVSYLISLVITGITFLLWFLFIGYSFHDNRFLTWIICNSVFLIVLQPWLMRFSRSLWISWFVKYDPHWKERPPEERERTNKDISNNW